MEFAFIRIVLLFLYLSIHPLFAFIINILGDVLDCPLEYLYQTIKQLQLFPKNIRCDTGINYQYFDKTIDIINGVIGLYFIQKSKYYNVLLALFIYRLVGIFLYFIFKNRIYLIIFANYFDYMFIYLILSEYMNYNVYPIVIIIIAILKLYVEYVLHYD